MTKEASFIGKFMVLKGAVRELWLIFGTKILTITAYAGDAAGNEGSSVPVNVIITNADSTPPSTQVTEWLLQAAAQPLP